MCRWSAWRLAGAASLSGLIDAFLASVRRFEVPLKGGTNGDPLFSERLILAKNGFFFKLHVCTRTPMHVCTRTPMCEERRKHLARQCVFVAVLSKRV